MGSEPEGRGAGWAQPWWPLAVIPLLTLRAFLGFGVQNLGEQLDLYELARLALLAALAGSLLGLAFAALFPASRQRCFSVLAVAALLAFAFADLASLLAGAGLGRLAQVLGYLGISGLSLAAAWRFGNSTGLCSALGLYAGAGIVLHLFQLLAADPAPARPDAVVSYPLEGNAVWSGQPLRRPSIYWLVADSYPNQQVSREIYGVEDPLAPALEAKGFRVAGRSYANYDFTVHSMASAFQMDHLFGDRERFMEERRGTHVAVSGSTNRSIPAAVSGDNRSVAQLRQLGYRYVHFANGWGATACRGFEDICLGSERARQGELKTLILELTPWPTLKTGLRRMGPSWFGESAPDDLEQVASALPDLPGDQPLFLYAHFHGAHGPFTHDATCRRREAVEARPGDFGGERGPLYQAFAGQLQCTATRLAGLVDQVLARDPEAIVIVSGDHGPRLSGGLDPASWTFTTPIDELSSEQIRDRLGVINALYLPPDCREHVSETLAPVNTMRVVLACLGGHEPRLLDSQHFVADWWRGNESFGQLRRVEPLAAGPDPAPH